MAFKLGARSASTYPHNYGEYKRIIINIYLVSWQQGFCFGFVEFEEASAVQNAVKVLECIL